MNRFFSVKYLVAAIFATSTLGAATLAQARPNVEISVGFQGGPAYFEPAPVYVQPRPVYVQQRSVYVEPAPVYVRPPVFVSPREVFERPHWGGYDSEREREWRRAEWRRHQWQQQHGDRDRDGDEHWGRHGR